MPRLLLALAALAAGCGCGTLRDDPIAPSAARPVVDGAYELARRYAPILYHDVDPDCGRQDLPGPFDFDGDLAGDDNWEEFPRFEIVPTVYYSVVETETHAFLSYHVHHPRDWAPVRLFVQDTHENDGENLQIVVERATDEVVMLFTQAHFCGGVYVNDRTRIDDGEEEIRGPFRLEGTHAAVFVESQGHGIYGEVDRFERGIVFRPALEASEPVPPYEGEATYVLESLPAKVWPGVASGELVGDGRLFDGVVRYRGIPIPRYYDGNRFSGPLGNDRGISPFALDFGFSEPDLGSLLVDPAGRYASVLSIRGPWSRTYVTNPFRAP